MHVFITSKHVHSDNLCIYGFPEAIFKTSAMENDKKQKLGLPSSSFYLSQIYNIYLWMYTFGSDKSWVIGHKTGALQ